MFDVTYFIVGLLQELIFIIPIASVLVFIIALVIYNVKKKTLSSSSEQKDIDKLKRLKLFVKISGVIAAVFVFILVVLVGLFFMFMNNM
ncbi:MAG: hypothetical protein IKL47_10785 [Clostridia bacterium]|nr:hypothetical protein [Clostridia bacterium]